MITSLFMVFPLNVKPKNHFTYNTESKKQSGWNKPQLEKKTIYYLLQIGIEKNTVLWWYAWFHDLSVLYLYSLQLIQLRRSQYRFQMFDISSYKRPNTCSGKNSTVVKKSLWNKNYIFLWRTSNLSRAKIISDKCHIY